MSVPTWSGDEHTLGTLRYRVLWFRVLLIAGVTTGLVGAFGMGHEVGQRESDAPPPGQALVSPPAEALDAPPSSTWVNHACDDGDGPATPITTAEERALREEALARSARADAAKNAEIAKNTPILEKLATSTISLNFESVPFHETIDFLRDVTKLNFVIGREARDLIENESLEVALRLKNISLRNAIKLILAADEELTYRVRRGVILIQTRDEADASELELQAYAVEDIVSGVLQGKGGASFEPYALVELLEESLDEGVGSLEYTAGPEGEKGTLLVRRSPREQVKVQEYLSYLRTLKRKTRAQPQWIRDYQQVLANRLFTLNFDETPLEEVISFLQDISGLNLTISSGVDSEELTVSLRLREVPLQDALRVILEQTHLAQSFVNQTILIHDPSDAGLHADYTLVIRDVRDLCTWLEGDMVQELVQNGTGEEFWDNPASLHVHRGQLIVRQTRAQHDQVAELLAKLRASRAQSMDAK